MGRLLLSLLALCTFHLLTYAQSGCTDPQAQNFDAAALSNDGSCSYAITNYSLNPQTLLPASMEEISGLIYFDGTLWALNDGGNANEIYQLNPTDGSIIRTVTISNASNTDWEDLAQDDTHLYVGDFGNNSGDRTDLKVYKVLKSDMGTSGDVSITASTIHFSYSDQVSFVTAPQANAFDCEAFFFANDSLHLFSKDWVNLSTRHYTLSINPGTYSISPKESFNVAGLVTAASINPSDNEIVLLGHVAETFFYILSDFNGTFFFSGNKRQISTGSVLTTGRVEGMAYRSDTQGYISTESFSAGGFTGVAQLYTYSTDTWTILPVFDLQFDATWQAQSQAVSLAWSTQREVQSDRFEIERAAAEMPQQFRKIGMLKAQGNSESLVNYAFTDSMVSSLDPKRYHYRLKQIDLDGQWTYSPLVEVLVQSPDQLLVYPNPSRTHFFIQSPRDARYELLTLQGKRVLRGDIKQNQPQKVQTGPLAAGIYFLKSSDLSGTQIQKLRVY